MTGAMLLTGKEMQGAQVRNAIWASNKVFGFDAIEACRKPSFGSSGRIAGSLSP